MEIRLGSSTPIRIGTAIAYPVSFDRLIVRESKEGEDERIQLVEGHEYTIGGIRWVFKMNPDRERASHLEPPGSFHHVASLFSMN